MKGFCQNLEKQYPQDFYIFFVSFGTGKETSTTRNKSLNENEHVIRVQSRTQAKFGLENFFTRNNSCHMFLLV